MAWKLIAEARIAIDQEMQAACRHQWNYFASDSFEVLRGRLPSTSPAPQPML
jgi:hypothetical protein